MSQGFWNYHHFARKELQRGFPLWLDGRWRGNECNSHENMHKSQILDLSEI